MVYVAGVVKQATNVPKNQSIRKSGKPIRSRERGVPGPASQ